MTQPNAPRLPPQAMPTKWFYGRAQERPLSQRQITLLEELYPRVCFNPDKLLPSPLWLEIGFGSGEHLLAQARTHPSIHFIGVEPYLNGLIKVLAGIKTYALTNVSLWRGNGSSLLASLPAQSLEHVFTFFPDPWPKIRHHKRRLISTDFINALHAALCYDGVFHFTSDINTYVNWTLQRLYTHGGFGWPVNFNLTDNSPPWRQTPPGWIPTRYETKALAAGRPCHYFRFKKQPILSV